VPLIRSVGDDTPIAWWEWLFAPLAPLVWVTTIPLLFVLAGLSIPYFMVYSDRHVTVYDFGTERQLEIIRRYRRYTARVSFWRRCGRVLAFPFQRRRPRRTRRFTSPP
jgi:hypothetical protein